MKTMKIRRFLISLFCLTLLLTALPVTAATDDSRWDTSTSENKKGNTVVNFSEVKFVLPEDWVDQVELVVEPAENRANVYHIASREQWTEELGEETGGFLFGIVFTENAVEENENILLIGHTADGYYYMYFPTDDQAYTKDPDTAEAYEALWDDIDWVKERCKLTVDPVREEDEYIIPNSSDTYLTEADLAGMNADEVQMAINEIYARHHRKFKLQDVQDYFNEQSWYTGTVDPDDFDKQFNSVMNDYEKANIEMMANYMNRIS